MKRWGLLATAALLSIGTALAEEDRRTGSDAES